MSELTVEGLKAGAAGEEILHGVDLRVSAGEVHAVMGPNGCGKSTLAHVLAGRHGYAVTAGRATLDGRELLELSPFERARAGLFLAMQYPTEVPGVNLADVLGASLRAAGRDPAADGLGALLSAEAERLGVPAALLERSVNVDLSGGEQKRGEALQLAVLRPRIAVLDEIDSGLDVDALRAVAGRIEEATTEGLGVLAITHYTRLLGVLRADRVHIMVRGQIVASGGPELADELERTGYERWERPAPAEVSVKLGRGF
ncbi:MAG: Fe-S cluster assembly ATPase SufC [bacterium]|nr:Fe-S cluster assembly ATPase SufC [bacterium]